MTFDELMAHSEDGVFAIGAERKIEFWNPACERITGISFSEAVGSACHEVLRGQDPTGRTLCKQDCPLVSLTRGGLPPSRMCMRIEQANGAKVQLSVSTLLMPSTRHSEWNVVHVMRPGRDSRTGRILDLAGQNTNAADGFRAPALGAPCQTATSRLTSREREILNLLAQGARINTMSEHLHISVATVRNHIQRLMAKLEVHSRLEAVAFAHRHQLV